MSREDGHHPQPETILQKIGSESDKHLSHLSHYAREKRTQKEEERKRRQKKTQPCLETNEGNTNEGRRKQRPKKEDTPTNTRADISRVHSEALERSKLFGEKPPVDHMDGATGLTATQHRCLSRHYFAVTTSLPNRQTRIFEGWVTQCFAAPYQKQEATEITFKKQTAKKKNRRCFWKDHRFDSLTGKKKASKSLHLLRKNQETLSTDSSRIDCGLFITSTNSFPLTWCCCFLTSLQCEDRHGHKSCLVKPKPRTDQ